MSKKISVDTRKRRWAALAGYFLAGLLLVATPTPGDNAQAAWRTDYITGTQNIDTYKYWTTARWMNNNVGVGNAAQVEVTGWDNALGIWNIAFGMRYGSAAGSTQFARTDVYMGYPSGWYSFYTPIGSTELPRTVFYLTTHIPNTASGGPSRTRTFYGNIGYSN